LHNHDGIMRTLTHETRDARSVHRGDLVEPAETTAIPAVEWQSFLERFGRRHRAWLTTVHGVEQGIPVRRAESVPLESVALERRGYDYLVRVMFGQGLSLCAPRARAVRVQHTDDGAEWALEIDTADGGFIRLAFRATTQPDQLDGLVPRELNTGSH
jgi:hypothetical protein